MYRQYKGTLRNDNECIMEKSFDKVHLGVETTTKMDFCDECGELVENICHACVSDRGNTTVDSSSTSEIAEQEPSQSAENNLDEIKVEWEREQIKIREKCCVEDCHDWSKFHITEENEEEFSEMEPLKYIGGVDISFVKGDDVNACAAFVVLSFPDLKVIYEDLSMVQLTAPYIAGYLAFREADFLVEKIEKLRKNKPEIMAQVIAVDGNGILHPRRCGLATHLGVLVDIPCYGIAKNLFHVDGIEKNEEHMSKIQSLEEAGDTFPLHTTDGELLGKALRAVEGSTNPVYVSAGHKISLDTCVWLTQKCSKKRIPEPTRQADLRSREYLRQQFLPPDPKQQKKQKQGKPKVPHKDPEGGDQETNNDANTAKEPSAETSELETGHPPKPDHKGKKSERKPSDVKPNE